MHSFPRRKWGYFTTSPKKSQWIACINFKPMITWPTLLPRKILWCGGCYYYLSAVLLHYNISGLLFLPNTKKAISWQRGAWKEHFANYTTSAGMNNRTIRWYMWFFFCHMDHSSAHLIRSFLARRSLGSPHPGHICWRCSWWTPFSETLWPFT